MSVEHQNLFQYVFDIKIKKIQVINMVSIKRYNRIIHRNIFLFLKTPYKQKVNKTTK